MNITIEPLEKQDFVATYCIETHFNGFPVDTSHLHFRNEFITMFFVQIPKLIALHILIIRNPMAIQCPLVIRQTSMPRMLVVLFFNRLFPQVFPIFL